MVTTKKLDDGRYHLISKYQKKLGRIKKGEWFIYIFFVKYKYPKSIKGAGVVQLNSIPIYFPKELIGKRVKFIVEISKQK